MGKLKPFTSMQTKWEGLWYQNGCGYYSSAALNLSDLREFKGTVRMVVRKNKWYNNGENGRPNMVFCLRDIKTESKIQDIRVQEIDSDWRYANYSEDEEAYFNEDGERLYTQDEITEAFADDEYITIDNAINIARNLLYDFEYGYSMDDLTVEVDSFMRQRAISESDIADILTNIKSEAELKREAREKAIQEERQRMLEQRAEERIRRREEMNKRRIEQKERERQHEAELAEIRRKKAAYDDESTGIRAKRESEGFYTLKRLAEVLNIPSSSLGGAVQSANVYSTIENGYKEVKIEDVQNYLKNRKDPTVYLIGVLLKKQDDLTRLNGKLIQGAARNPYQYKAFASVNNPWLECRAYLIKTSQDRKIERMKKIMDEGDAILPIEFDWKAHAEEYMRNLTMEDIVKNLENGAENAEIVMKLKGE